MNRFLLPLAVFVLLLAVLLVGLRRAPDKSILPSPLIGKPAPQFTLPNLFDNTSPLQSDSLKGHWSLVNVWGTWCVECRAEHSVLLQIKQEARVPIIGIDWRDHDEDALSWLAQLGNPYQRVGTDHDGKVAIDWGVYGAPESFLIDPAGTVVYKHIGPLTMPVWQHEFLPRLSRPAGPGA
ncbi:MAG TPA: DsbE family thiol:disulfide interchange protein [Steroidobacteraceae bacterium]|jgi:cytochrome c biogenesis protein CcmG/thiol:disulfide interchange protein DsbE